MYLAFVTTEIEYCEGDREESEELNCYLRDFISIDNKNINFQFGLLEVDQTELYPTQFWNSLLPTNGLEHNTGNEGVRIENFYTLSAIVIWPIEKRKQIILQSENFSSIIQSN